MAKDLITSDQRSSIKLVVPFALAGWVFYSGYAKKGKTDWQGSGMMALIVFVCAYIVTSQTLKFMNPDDTV